MIGLAAAAILLAPLSAPAGGHPAPLSVAVQASGAQDVSYAIEVRNTTDQTVTDAVITQQLPPGLDYVAATPAPHRTGRHLSRTLTIPAHGTARIATTGAAGHHLAARPLDHVTQAGPEHHGHRQPLTTVCAREDTGPQSCATGRGALRPQTVSDRERGTLVTAGAATATIAALLAGTRLRRRRRRRRRTAGALERAGVEG
ncbi:putative repeat protein (TIGR01451 family) [Catenulispora sp. GP43]|uniref:hypothetical protein n=1 Tax=Catenulispora sp. GP43 TaxID=3156263 RepID=UPI0035196994